MIKLPKWSLHDLNFVLDCFKKTGSEKMTQKQINESLIYERKRLGTWKGEKDLSWQISRLSKGSKHKQDSIEKIRSPHAFNNVVRFIQKCMKCNYLKASDIYLSRIIESGISDFNFYDPNQNNLTAIRFDHPYRCKDELYIAFTSEDYDDMEDDNEEINYEMNEETGELEEVITKEPKDNQPQTNVWTVKTSYQYQQILTGKVNKQTLEDYLKEIAEDYIPIYVNCCVLRDDTEV